MSLLVSVLMGSVCRSTHHKLAIQSLLQLRGTDGEAWCNLFLHHHAAFLEGAKAPDDVFKDFKNHVLHVREGDWGGAPTAAREWYRRTVRALSLQDWKRAAYCAGVMSHYAVDPIQPFHTAQTEEEGIVHRAVEWSIAKSYKQLALILEQDLGGFPEVTVPAGNDWLEQMIKAGARVANPHYETLIDHYNLALGVKTPEKGLDQELKDTIAKLLGYASTMLARILEKACAEAAIAPPKVGLTFDALMVTLKIPFNAVLKTIDNAKERALVGAMYNEYLATGKVRQTLPDDDKQVRRLHALEVLKTPISSIDAQWPREPGTAHGTGRPARVTKKTKPARTETKRAKIEPKVTAPEIIAAQPKQKPGKDQKTAATPAPKTVSAGTQLPQGLSHNSPVEEAPSIGAKTASRLSQIGVVTVRDLLSMSPDDVAARLKFKHINARLVRDWQAQAELACRIPGLPSIAAQLLVAVGVRDLDDLANADADMLVNMIDEHCETAEGQRVLRDSVPPGEEHIQQWINIAREQTDRQAA